RRTCGRHRIRGTGEGDEERVAGGVDLDSAMTRPHLAQDPLMFREHLGVAVTELLQQTRRALDVGEEERDRPGRKLGPHPAILPPRAGKGDPTPSPERGVSACRGAPSLVRVVATASVTSITIAQPGPAARAWR